MKLLLYLLYQVDLTVLLTKKTTRPHATKNHPEYKIPHQCKVKEEQA